MKKLIRPTLAMLATMMLVTGLAYPLLVTAIGQIAFNDRANGSLVIRDGKVVGSELIGQSFSAPKYFWSRPSATAPMANNGAASGGSNLGPTNPALKEAVAGRISALRSADPGNTQPVPIDLVTASASGLDLHISEAAARYQVGRVAAVRGLAAKDISSLVDAYREKALLGFIGEPRVNVLRINLALDALAAPGKS